jgi:hypothetical protein
MCERDGGAMNDCKHENLEFREHSWTETHGLDCGPYEYCHEEWWRCRECGESFTEGEIDKIFQQQWEESV